MEALEGDVVVEGPAFVTINVLDVNNHAPQFSQGLYTAVVRENNAAGVCVCVLHRGDGFLFE